MDDRQLGRIEATVDAIEANVKEIKDLVREQNGRIKKLEVESAETKGSWRVVNIVSGIIGGVVTLVGGYATKYL